MSSKYASATENKRLPNAKLTIREKIAGQFVGPKGIRLN